MQMKGERAKMAMKYVIASIVFILTNQLLIYSLFYNYVEQGYDVCFYKQPQLADKQLTGNW